MGKTVESQTISELDKVNNDDDGYLHIVDFDGKDEPPPDPIITLCGQLAEENDWRPDGTSKLPNCETCEKIAKEMGYA